MNKIKNKFAPLIKYRNLSVDVIYNLLASFVITFTIQFIVYPSMALTFNSNLYGIILTTFGIVNAVSVSFGNSLSNTRLKQDAEYINRNIQGDFQLLNVFSMSFGSLITVILCVIYFDLSITLIFFLVLYTILLIARTYYSVAFRLLLNYKKNLYCCIFISLGYIIGTLIFNNNKLWPLIFVIGEVFGLIYLFLYTDIFREKLVKTNLFSVTNNIFFVLIVSGLIGNLLIYADRLLLYPIIGGQGVSIYNTASIFSKALGIVLGPLSSVILSYVAKQRDRVNKRHIIKIILITIILSFIFYVFTIIIAPILLKKLYPTLAEKSISYVPIVSITCIFVSLNTVLQPFVLIFAPSRWQIIKEIVYAVIYIVLGIVLAVYFGIFGFSIASIIANLFKSIILIFATFHYMDKDKK